MVEYQHHSNVNQLHLASILYPPLFSFFPPKIIDSVFGVDVIVAVGLEGGCVILLSFL